MNDLRGWVTSIAPEVPLPTPEGAGCNVPPEVGECAVVCGAVLTVALSEDPRLRLGEVEGHLAIPPTDDHLGHSEEEEGYCNSGFGVGGKGCKEVDHARTPAYIGRMTLPKKLPLLAAVWNWVHSSLEMPAYL